jgi:SAM-dependent methyltransferase
LFANSTHHCRLRDVYYFPEFPKVISHIFPQERVSQTWIERLRYIPENATVLEIGAGSGRFTNHILRRSISVDAVEQHEEFFNELCTLRDSFPKLRPIRGLFPDIELSVYSHIIMHQNVFLELINESTLQETFDSLKRVLLPSGVILLDYPTCFSPPASGGVLFKGSIPQLGKLQYMYEDHRSLNSLHTSILIYQLVDKARRYFVRARLSFEMPSMLDVRTAAETAGFEFTVGPLENTLSFFSSSMNLIQLRRR